MTQTPERKARLDIDAALEAAGWILQNGDAINVAAGPGMAVREARMASRHGFADYLLFVNGQAVGAIEAKPAGLGTPVRPLPFVYMSTGVETRFINGLDPDPKTRTISANLPHIHRPETLAEWIGAETLDAWVKRLHAEAGGLYTAADDSKPTSLRGRLTTLPPWSPPLSLRTRMKPWPTWRVRSRRTGRGR